MVNLTFIVKEQADFFPNFPNLSPTSGSVPQSSQIFLQLLICNHHWGSNPLSNGEVGPHESLPYPSGSEVADEILSTEHSCTTPVVVVEHLPEGSTHLAVRTDQPDQRAEGGFVSKQWVRTHGREHGDVLVSDVITRRGTDWNTAQLTYFIDRDVFVFECVVVCFFLFFFHFPSFFFFLLLDFSILAKAKQDWRSQLKVSCRLTDLVAMLKCICCY